MPTPHERPDDGAEPGDNDATVRQVRRLRERLSACQEKLRRTEEALEAKGDALREERAHADGLGRLLDRAHDRLDDAGLNDRLDFPVSRNAIRLYDELDLPASFDEIMSVGAAMECSDEETATLMAELVDEGVLRRTDEADGRYVATGREPWF